MTPDGEDFFGSKVCGKREFHKLYSNPSTSLAVMHPRDDIVEVALGDIR